MSIFLFYGVLRIQKKTGGLSQVRPPFSEGKIIDVGGYLKNIRASVRDIPYILTYRARSSERSECPIFS